MAGTEMEIIHEDVVISGIGGYFPQSLNIEQFQKNLLENKDLVGTRWRQGERGVSNKVGTVPTEFFDNSYFGIHRQQCTYMDPMQRLVLERTFEALVDAGVNPAEVKGRRIGVFMGSAIGENDNLFLESIVSGFGVTGHSRAMMPNRVSYWLNLKGPSVAYDSNWVGGMEVIRLAYDAIRTGQCESVIVGTANLALNAEFQWLYTDMGLLSPDGTTRAFDADAQGYARSDGVVVLYIQKASEARRSYASIVNVATTFDGNREGTLQDISVENLATFMNEFYEKIPIKPENVEFLETYGCGNKKTDEKELAAIEKVYCKNRKEPLLIGSVKTNTGHSEASAVMFQVAKVLIAMETGVIPATLRYETPNPKIKALVDGKIQVVTENRKWKPTYAAINSLGLDSYYGHLLLKAHYKNKIATVDAIPRLIIASTRTEEGIKEALEEVNNKSSDPEYLQMVQDLFGKPILGHLYRGYTVTGVDKPMQEFEYHQGTKRQIWFVYSGMGSQWNGMVSDLMNLPIFADAINKCHNILAPKGVDLLKIITSDDKTMFDNILHSFVGIAAIQIALTDILRAVGIVPDGIIGHSVGELGCAYSDGCMTAEQMILSAYSRGRASLEAELIPGMMAAIGVGYNAIKSKLPPTIEVACHNGPDSATLSGPREDMEKFVAELQAQGIFARLVNVANIAYHSRYIKPAAPFLLKYLQDVVPKTKRSSKWVSTSNLEENWNTDLAQYSSAEYHTNNLLSSVYFEEGLKSIPKDSILIEIAPHGLLQAILKRSVKTGCTNIPLTQRGSKSGLEFLLTALGKMYLAGMDLSILNIYPKLEYPVSKGTPSLAPLSHWNHTETWRTGLEDKLHSLFSVADMQVTLNSEEFRECVGHQLDDNIILPTSFYLNIAYQLITTITTERKEVVFENLHFKKVLKIPKIGSVPLHAMVQKGSGDFEITSNKEIIMSGTMTFPQPNEKFMLEPTVLESGEDNVHLSGNDIYNELQHRGHKYSGLFKTIKSLSISEEGSSAVIQWNNKWTMFLEAMIQQQLLQSGERYQDIRVPRNIQKICIDLSKVPKEQCDLKVDYEYSTKMICTDGFHIVGMQTMPIEKDKKSVYIDSVEYVPLSKNVYSKMETGICVALQLMLANFYDQYITNVMITEIESNEPFLEQIQSALSQYPKLNPNIVTAKDAKQVVVQNAYPLLIISNNTINEDLAKVVSSSHAFLLIKSDKSLLSYPKIVSIANFVYNNQSYSLLRKANETDVSIVSAKCDVLTIKDLKRSSASWVSELYSAVEAASSTNKRVYLTSPVIPVEGYTNFVQELRAQPNMNCLRILINLDKKVNVDLKEVYRQDLVLSIIKDGIYSAYMPIPVKFKEDLFLNTATSNLIKNQNVSYIGLSLRDETINAATEKPQELGLIDYSGTTNTGQGVMGIATLDTDNCKLIPDPILNWELPSNYWSLEDAATVPYAYTAAYYALYTKAQIKPGNTVLVHAGCSPVGIAAISIALANGCTVYTTVSTDTQREYIKKLFQQLRDNQVLSSDNSSFEPFIMMATGGKGADIIINCLSGSLLHSSFACIADFGRFLHIGKYDMEENNSIGMYTFLRNVSFFAVDFNNIVNQHDDVKRELKELVQNGITKMWVRPLWRVIYNHQDIATILKNINKDSNIGKAVLNINNNLSINKLNVKRPTQFMCDAKSSYLVYGGNAEQWTDMAEWLVLRGAKKIVISSDSKSQQNHINRRLSLLQTYFDCDIIFAPNKANTREGAAELLSEVYFLGLINGVFLLPQNKTASSAKASDIKPVQYIDHALRTTAPKALFVNFISSAAGICQVRADLGFPTYNIDWLSELEFADVLSGLDDILTLKVKNILVNNDKVSDSKQESTQALFKKLTQMLPPSPEELGDQTDDAPDEPELIQLVTEGPREIRELVPLFIIPGLNTNQEIEELARSLLVPTFQAVLPRSLMTLKELAEKYVELIRNICPEGPYNIVGVSWGGVLATEIAKVFDKLYKPSIHLYFIDGAPSTLQSAIKHLGEGNEMEVNLLSRIFNNNDAQVIKRLQSAPDWKSRVSYLLNLYNNDSVDKKDIEDGLLLIRNRLQEVTNYRPDEHLISGSVHLIRPSDCSEYDNCELTLYFKQIPQVFLVTGDHITIIKKGETAEYINETFQLI